MKPVITKTDFDNAEPPNYDQVDRIVVVNHSYSQPFGRVFEKHDIQVELSLQDGGRTLKVFVNERTKT